MLVFQVFQNLLKKGRKQKKKLELKIAKLVSHCRLAEPVKNCTQLIKILNLF